MHWKRGQLLGQCHFRETQNSLDWKSSPRSSPSTVSSPGNQCHIYMFVKNLQSCDATTSPDSTFQGWACSGWRRRERFHSVIRTPSWEGGKEVRKARTTQTAGRDGRESLKGKAAPAKAAMSAFSTEHCQRSRDQPVLMVQTQLHIPNCHRFSSTNIITLAKLPVLLWGQLSSSAPVGCSQIHSYSFPMCLL